MKPKWKVRQLPRQDRRTFLVTGATGGIDYFIAEQLAATGAQIILLGRSEIKAQLAIRATSARVPAARLRFICLDLADLTSVQNAAELPSSW